MRRPSSYRDLDVWQQAIDLAVVIATLATALPVHAMFVLGLQLRRASRSISSNIAEGDGRSTRQEYIRFLRIARGSAAKVSSLLIGTWGPQTSVTGSPRRPRGCLQVLEGR